MMTILQRRGVIALPGTRKVKIIDRAALEEGCEKRRAMPAMGPLQRKRRAHLVERASSRVLIAQGIMVNSEIAAIKSVVATRAPERLNPRAASTPSHGVEKRRCRRRPGQSPRAAVA